MHTRSRVPYWELSGFYFFYFAFVGAMSPYWPLYLHSVGLPASEIGVLMSLLAVMRVFAPNVWGAIADRTGRRVAIVQLAALLSLGAFGGVFLGQDFWTLFAAMAALSFFWSASLPLVEATTLSHLRGRVDHYGRIRLWGSVGFVLAVVGLGYVLDRYPILLLPWLIAALLAGVALFARHIPEADVFPEAGDHEPIVRLLSKPQVVALIVACFFMSAAHGPYYTFYSLALELHGYSKAQVGWLWALGVLCEIGVFLLMPRLAARFRLEHLLAASFALAVVRFLAIAWGVRYPAVALAAQSLHAATFGIYHAVAVSLVHRFFPGRHQGKGQALYSSISFGAGGAVGSLYAGYAWQSWGPEATFSLAAACALLGLSLVLWQLLPRR